MASLDILASAGLTVTADGDRLLVHPRHLLTDDLRFLIRDNKPDILSALSDAANVTRPVPEMGAPPAAAVAADGSPQRLPEWDERRTCQHCRNLSAEGRCLAAWRGELFGVSRDFEPIKDMLQRCASYAPGQADIDQRERRFATYCISKMNHAANRS